MAGAVDGRVNRLKSTELMASVPGLAATGITVTARDVRTIPSACLRYEDMLAVFDAARDAVTTGAGGVVVVQGTDTIEETSFLLDLLWADDTALVVTGAMRNPTLPGADGPANLLAAIIAAASEGCRGLGALVVMNDEIHAARHVAKRHSSSTAAFESPDAGAVGRVVEGGVRMLARPARMTGYPRPAQVSVRVPLVVTVFDDDGVLLDGLDERCDGVVIAGFGVGHVPDRLADRIGALAAARPVVLASRTGAGPVFRGTYRFAGSETDLLGRGLVSAGRLGAFKARVLLSVLIASGADRAAITAAFAEYE
jgi:L-asparaginase